MSKPKVFLVDDHKIMNYVLGKMLVLQGVTDCIFEYDDPLLALKDLKIKKPDLILLDLNMPNFSGWDFLDELHEIGPDHTKVILITGSSRPEDKAQSKKYPMVVDFLKKPLSKENISSIGKRYNS
ncbi:MAG: response regulator [Cytophagaceae bacterium]|nr:response regulator [Cytophagaceae bacterium]|tara:strand:- start:806 stop:1180 length:375 start_codon:yes stop_codon:yes gene_type:complete